MLSSHRYKIIGILLISWGLLVRNLEQNSLWVDEFLTLGIIQGSLLDVINSAINDIHPPLYFISLNIWVRSLNSSDFILRLLSVFSGIISVALMVPISKRLIDKRSAVLLAVFFLGISPAFIEFSRMARYYALVTMIGLLSTYLLLQAVKRDVWSTWLAYAISVLCLLFTFYPSIILLLVHPLIVFTYSRSAVKLRHWTASFLMIWLAFLPWLVVVAQRQVIEVSQTSGSDLSRSLIGFSLGIASSFYTFGIGETLFPWRIEALTAMGTMALIFGVALVKSPRTRVWPVFALFMAPVIFISFIATFVNAGTPFLNVPVRGIFALPFFILVLVTGITKIPRAKWRSLAIAVLFVVWGRGIYNYFSVQQFLNPIYFTASQEAALFVEQNANKSDVVISDYDSVFGRYFHEDMVSQHYYTGQVDEIGDHLGSSTPDQIFLIIIGRDQTRGQLSRVETIKDSLVTNYELVSIERFNPIDPFYLMIKERILGRDSYKYRLSIEKYARLTK